MDRTLADKVTTADRLFSGGGEHGQRGGVIPMLPPDIIPFDAAGDDGPDDTSPGGGGGVAVAGHVVRLAPAAADPEAEAAARGYSVFAARVVVDGRGEPVADECGDLDLIDFDFRPEWSGLPSLGFAVKLALDVSNRPHGVRVPANFVLVNDGAGRTVKRLPVRAA